MYLWWCGFLFVCLFVWTTKRNGWTFSPLYTPKIIPRCPTRRPKSIPYEPAARLIFGLVVTNILYLIPWFVTSFLIVFFSYPPDNINNKGKPFLNWQMSQDYENKLIPFTFSKKLNTLVQRTKKQARNYKNKGNCIHINYPCHKVFYNHSHNK